MNIKLLEKVKAHILEEPRRVNMAYWLALKDTTGVTNAALPTVAWATVMHAAKNRAPACGTVGCIAGWTIIVARKKRAVKALTKAGTRYPIAQLAADVLGLTQLSRYEEESLWSQTQPSQRMRLFLPDRWPEPFRAKLKTHRPGTKAYAKVIAKRIDFFIKTNGTDDADGLS